VNDAEVSAAVAAVAMLGDFDLAYEFAGCVVSELERSGMLKASAGYCNQFWQSEMRPFRQDSRFGLLAEKLGLSRYWAVHGAPDADVQ
jgi:hypothetical protein